METQGDTPPVIKKITVVGTGTLGVQIALMAAHYGGQARTYDPDEKAFDRVLALIRQRMANAARRTLPPFENLEEGARKIHRCAGLAEAVADADLVIEAVPENLELKRRIFQQMDRLAPREAILATNSSSIPVSKIESATSRPEKCLNIHFYSPDLGRNIVDLMGGTRTSGATMEAARRWLLSIGCVPLPVKKELLGFCFNRIWRAIKREALHMWAGGHVDFRDIDRGYMIWNGVSQGPFALMDQVGLDVVYGIEMVYYEESQDPKDHPPEALKIMIERNELGVKTGKGFYTYPHPEYKNPDFLKGSRG
jgi:3-hydroxybutyryl-CoA dehydrogenase